MTWQPLDDERESEPRPLSASLDRVAQSLGVGRADVLRDVFRHWDEVVGADVAAHARPLALRAGVLVVAVDHPAWATQLRYLDADLRRRLDEVAGAGVIVEVEVRVRPS